MSVPRQRMAGGGGPAPEFIVRDFLGMANHAAREAIQDDEFYWCKNAIPLAGGNLQLVNQALSRGATLNLETSPPSYVMAFYYANAFDGTVFGVYVFAWFANTGNAYIIKASDATVYATQIPLGVGGKIYATQYNNQGILIVHSTAGYFDFGVTANHAFTSWNNSLSGATITFKTSIGGGTVLKQVGFAGGTGGLIHVNYQVISATINAAGAGYVVGDVLSFTDGTPVTPAQIVVTAIGGIGDITGIGSLIPGSYPGPDQATTPIATGPTGTVVAGGTGAGATFTIKIQALSVTVSAPGKNYINGQGIQDETNVGSIFITSYKLTTSGIVAGTSVATFAGHVWIASGRTVYISDINSYSFFGGTGTSFTINDSYLLNNITCLYAANNYLYIFGDTSVDALSNVTVSAVTGLLSFSRINLTSSVGTSDPMSVFGYYRGIVFYHRTGIYLLVGATPEKISEKISGLIRNALFANTGTNAAGCLVTIQGEQCIAMQLSITDVWTANGAVVMYILLYFRNRWWLYDGQINQGAIFSPNLCSCTSPNTGTPLNTQNMYTFSLVGAAHPLFFQAFAATSLATCVIQTKLYDGGAPLREKQSLNAALAGVLKGLGASGITFTVDTELGSSASKTFPVTGTPSGYQLLVEQAVQGGSSAPAQYLGLTVTADGTDVSQVNLVALRGKTERDFLQ